MSNLDPKLVAEIVAHPLEDATRLVLADALQEKGDPRGHFIVAQCRLAERGLPRDERVELKREVSRLSSANGRTWAGPAAKLRSFELRRGFVDEVVASATELAPISTELFATQPITRLTIDGASTDAIALLAKADAFARVLHLRLGGPIGDAGAEALANALRGRKTPLLSLNVGGNGISASGVTALAAALAGCRSLVLTENGIGDGGVTSLAQSKALASLEVLFLTANELTDECLPVLAKSANLGSLSRLGLARNDDITPEGLAAISSSKKLRKLRWLEYSGDNGQAVAVRGR